MSQTASDSTDISTAPPVWHAGIALLATVIAGAILFWGVLERVPFGILVGGPLSILFLFACLDALTSRIRITDREIQVRDRVLRCRSYGIKDVSEIRFEPGELFELRFNNGDRLRFPAGSAGLDEIDQRLSRLSER